jgi:hypothetical protein
MRTVDRNAATETTFPGSTRRGRGRTPPPLIAVEPDEEDRVVLKALALVTWSHASASAITAPRRALNASKMMSRSWGQ